MQRQTDLEAYYESVNFACELSQNQTLRSFMMNVFNTFTPMLIIAIKLELIESGVNDANQLKQVMRMYIL